MTQLLTRYRPLVGVWVSIVALAAAGQANTIDPQMGMTDAGDSNAFYSGVMFGPDSNGGGVISFYNATGATIVSVTFATTLDINPNLQPTFSCNNANNPLLPNPFFLNCSADYDPTTEYLQFQFYGTGQSGDGSNLFYGGSPQTLGPDDGIPPGLQFVITFNYNFSLNVDSGGWGAVGNPTFTAIDVETDPSPEPSPALLAGAALIAGAGLLLLRSRRIAGRPRLSENVPRAKPALPAD